MRRISKHALPELSELKLEEDLLKSASLVQTVHSQLKQDLLLAELVEELQLTTKTGPGASVEELSEFGSPLTTNASADLTTENLLTLPTTSLRKRWIVKS